MEFVESSSHTSTHDGYSTLNRPASRPLWLAVPVLLLLGGAVSWAAYRAFSRSEVAPVSPVLAAATPEASPRPTVAATARTGAETDARNERAEPEGDQPERRMKPNEAEPTAPAPTPARSRRRLRPKTEVAPPPPAPPAAEAPAAPSSGNSGNWARPFARRLQALREPMAKEEARKRNFKLAQDMKAAARKLPDAERRRRVLDELKKFNRTDNVDAQVRILREAGEL